MAQRLDRGQSGFTLIELMTVIAIIGILVGVALPQYKNAIISAKEAVLVENLHTMRDAMDQYTADKGKDPSSLEELAEKGYLKTIPKDPVDPSAAWVTVPCESSPAEAGDANQQPGICDVKSGAEGMSLNFGKPYNEL